MNNIKKIGWQKYEDFVEKQMTSPLLNNIMKHLIANIETHDAETDEEYEEENEDDDRLDASNFLSVMPITKELIDDLSMIANFDCWIGHTNFDLTYDIKNKLDKVPGIELLKICSRYRFFIGIGQMFNFKDVRNSIEKEIILQGD